MPGVRIEESLIVIPISGDVQISSISSAASATCAVQTVYASNINGATISATNISATTFSGTNVYATTVTATNLSGTAFSGTNVYATTVTATNISATNSSAGSGYFATRVGIGTATPANELDIATNSNPTIRLYNSVHNGLLRIVSYSSGVIHYVNDYSQGTLGFGTQTRATDLTITSAGIVGATTLTSTNLSATTFSGTSVYATTVTATNVSGTTFSATTCNFTSQIVGPTNCKIGYVAGYGTAYVAGYYGVTLCGSYGSDNSMPVIKGVNSYTGSDIEVFKVGALGTTILSGGQGTLSGANVYATTVTATNISATSMCAVILSSSGFCAVSGVNAIAFPYNSGLLEIWNTDSTTNNGIRFSKGTPGTWGAKIWYAETGGVYRLRMGQKDGAPYLTIVTDGTGAGTVSADTLSSSTLYATTVTATTVSAATISGGNLYAASATPASMTAAGIPGQITWDSSYAYICISANGWKRFELQTW